MSARLHRTQILLEPEQHRMLSKIAEAEQRSMSELVRELVDIELARRDQESAATKQRQLAALEQIRRHREEILAKRGGMPLNMAVVDLIDENRSERDGDILLT
jgi:predicted DNA-binding ribbon-helix-helix protein